MLVKAGPEIFTMFKPGLRKYAQKALDGRDVEVLCGQVVESVTPTRVTLKSGRVIPAHTLVWGAGLQANPLVRSLGVELRSSHRRPHEAQRRQIAGWFAKYHSGRARKPIASGPCRLADEHLKIGI